MSKKPNDKRSTRLDGNAEKAELDKGYNPTYYEGASTDENKGNFTHGTFKNSGQKSGQRNTVGDEQFMNLHPASQGSELDAQNQNQKPGKSMPKRSPRQDGQGAN